MDIAGYLRQVLSLLWITYLPGIIVCQLQLFKDELKKVSQCYQPGGFSFVSLYCGYGRVIQIQRAFHGLHRNPALAHCGLLDSDCTDDTTHTYDWTKCEGRHNCVQMIQSQVLGDKAGCEGLDMLYLEVHYTCVQGTVMSGTTTVKPPTNPMMAETEPTPAPDIHTICTNYTSADDSMAYVISPGYPYYYPSNTECRCVIKAQPKSKVLVTYQDLALLMRAGQCVDWLLLQSLGYKNSAAVTCGQMGSGQEKTLTAKGNWLLLHFHTAKGKETDKDGSKMDQDVLDPKGKVMRNMKGFKVKVTSQPTGPMQVQCYKASSSVLANLKYKDSKHDASDNIILPQSDLNAIAQLSSANNTASVITPQHSGYLSLWIGISLTVSSLSFLLM